MRHQFVIAADRRQWKATTDDLAKAAHIGRHAVVGLGAAIGETKAGDDLVENQWNLVFSGHLAQGF